MLTHLTATVETWDTRMTISRFSAGCRLEAPTKLDGLKNCFPKSFEKWYSWKKMDPFRMTIFCTKWGARDRNQRWFAPTSTIFGTFLCLFRFEFSSVKQPWFQSCRGDSTEQWSQAHQPKFWTDPQEKKSVADSSWWWTKNVLKNRQLLHLEPVEVFEAKIRLV